MIWLGIAIVIAAAVVGVVAVRRSGTSRPAGDVDPTFALGLVLTGTGVALATTVGNVMYAVMTVGLILVAVGAHRTRRHDRR